MEIFHTLWQLVIDLFNVIVALLQLGLHWWLLIVWVGWWTLAVNWRSAWRWLALGAWVPLVLLGLVAALVWSRLDPQPLDLGILTVANFWWQLGAVAAVIGLTLLCGWVQQLIGWNPPEVDLEPPAHAEHAHAYH